MRMSQNRNKFGLSRNIPESVKEYIRKRDGFGCVHCGRGIYTFEHFKPEFKYARSHEQNGIALLCGQCQEATTKGILSKKTIEEDIKNPYCKKKGYSNDFFDLKHPIILYLGNIRIRVDKGCLLKEILVLNDQTVVSCCEDTNNGPLLLNALFKDRNNNVCLKIENNEWQANIRNWDVTQTANKLEIYHYEKDIGIALHVNPPHEINFTKLSTYFDGNRLYFSAREGLISVTRVDGTDFKINVKDQQQVNKLSFNF